MSAAELRVEVRAGAVRVDVHVQPRASSSGLACLHGTALKVRLQAPPVEGAANAALVELLADILGVPRRAVRVIAGSTSRAKTVEIEGTTEAAVRGLTTQADEMRMSVPR